MIKTLGDFMCKSFCPNQSELLPEKVDSMETKIIIVMKIEASTLFNQSQSESQQGNKGIVGGLFNSSASELQVHVNNIRDILLLGYP